MAIPGKLKPFPSPAPRADGEIDPFVVRGNDNLLAQTLNAVIDTLNAQGATSASDYLRVTQLFDPRLAPDDADHILASQVFGA